MRQDVERVQESSSDAMKKSELEIYNMIYYDLLNYLMNEKHEKLSGKKYFHTKPKTKDVEDMTIDEAYEILKYVFYNKMQLKKDVLSTPILQETLSKLKDKKISA